VETPDGKRAEGVLVRSYADGEVAVLALGNKRRSAGSETEGRRCHSFVLPARGVFVHQTGRAPPRSQERLSAGCRGGASVLQQVSCTNFSLSLADSTTLRLVFGFERVARLNVAQTIDACGSRCGAGPRRMR
jgi:hypothetical protein